MVDNNYLNRKYSDIDDKLKVYSNDIKLDYGIDAINNSIDNILRIPYYSVPGRPDFGSNIESFLFEIMDRLTESALKLMIEELLLKFEPRVVIYDVKVLNFVQNQLMLLEISYYLSDRIDDTELINHRVTIGGV